jgi:filamentous hemagglutinin family protein
MGRHSMRTNRDRRTIRHMLVLGTALSGSWMTAGQQQAWAAQVSGSLPSGVAVVGSPSDLKVILTKNAVIGWDNFDIKHGNSVDFADGRGLGGGGALAVLNRDNSGHATSIDGMLTSDPNIAVWIYNPSGILIGANAHISTGSLVLTTLNPKDDDFKPGANPTSYVLSDPGVTTQGIMVADKASLNVSGGSRGLILVSPVINAAGSFDALGKKPNVISPKAADQDVAFVTATAATLSYSAGSPVSIQIDKGTNLAKTNIVSGSVQGRNVYFAVASQSTITGALLQVSADVTSAAKSGNGIVLAAGTSGSNVSLAGGTATSGVVDVKTLTQDDHSLITQVANTGVLVSTNGTASLGGVVKSAGDVQVSAANKATITGNITAQRNYSVAAGGVELAGTQAAGAALTIQSQDSAITGDDGLSLQSGANGGGGALTLRTIGAAGGNIALAGNSSLLAGKVGNANGNVQIGVALAGNAIALGDVAARSLLGAIGSGSFGDTVSTTGALSLGQVDTVSSLKLSGGTLSAGALTSKNDINLESVSNLQAGSLSAGGSVILNGGAGAVAVTGNVQAGGQYAVTGSRVALGDASAAVRQQANGAVTISAGTGGMRGLGSLTLESNADHAGTEALTLAITDASSDAAIDFATNSVLLAGPGRQSDLIIRSGTAAGLVALGDVSARNLLGAVGAAAPAQGLARTSALRLGDVVVSGPLSLAGAAISTGDLTSNGAVSLNAAGAMTVASISSAGSTSLLGSGATIIAGHLQATGDVTIDRGAALTLGSLQAGGKVALGGTSGLTTITVTGPASSGGSFTALSTGAQHWADLSSGGALSLTGAGVTAAILKSGGTTAIASAGAVQAASIDSVGGVSLTGTGATTISGTVRTHRASDGDLTINRDGAIVLGGLNPARTVAIGSSVVPTSVTVNGDAEAGGAFSVTSSGAQHWAAISSGGALSLTGAGVVAASITSASTTTITSTGALQASSIDSADGITLAGTGATTISGTIKTDHASDGDLTINRDGAIVLGGFNPARNVSIGGSVVPTSVIVNGDARAGGSITVVSSGAQNWHGGISAGGSLLLAPVSGTLQVAGSIVGHGVVTLTSADAVTLGGTIQAGGAVGVSGTTVRLGDLATTAGNVAVAATQGLNVGSISAPGSVTLTAGQGLVAAGVTGSQGVVLAAKGGNLEVDGAIDGGTGAVSATATNAVSLQHSVKAGGDYQVSGSSVTLGGIQSAGGAVSVTAGAGGITGLSGLDLTANKSGSGTGGIALSATGGRVALAGDTVLNGGPDHQSEVSIASDTGDIALGNVNARALSVNGGKELAGGFTAGNLSLADSLTLLAGTPGIRLGNVTLGAGDLSLGSLGALQIGNVSTLGGIAQLTGTSLQFGAIKAAGAVLTSNGAAAGSGTISGGAVTSTGPVQISALSGDGTVTLGPITTTGTTGALVLNAVGRVLLDKVAVSGTADIATVTNTADILFKNGLTAGGTIHVSSTHDVRADTITSIDGDLYVSAPHGSLGGYTPGSGLNTSVGAGHTYSLDVGDDINLGIVIGGPISLTANSITAYSIDAGGSDVTLNASSGDVTIAHDVRGANIELGATDFTKVGGNVIATGTVALSGGKGVRFHDISGASVSITSMGAISGGSITSPGTIGVSGTTLALDGLDAGGDAAVTTLDGDLSVSGAVNGSAVTLTSAGLVKVGGTLTAAQTATLDGATGVSFASISAPSVSITSGGAVTGKSIGATGDAIVQGTTVALNSLDVGGTASLTSTQGDLTVSGDVDAGTAKLISTGAVKLGGTLTAKNAATLDGASGVTFAAISGPSVSITSGGAITGTSIGATGDAVVQGTTVALNSLDVGGTASLTTTQGDLVVSGDVDAGTAKLVSAGAVKLGGTLTAKSAAMLDGANDVTFTTISAPSVSIASGGVITGKSVAAAGDIAVQGASVALTSLQAGGGASLTAKTGSLSLGDGTTGTDLVIDANGLATVAGNVATGGRYSVRGASLVIGGDGRTQQAGGQMLLASTDGAIQAIAGTTLVANAGGTIANAMLINSAGGIAMGNTTLDSKGGNLGLEAGAGQAVALGDVKAGRVGGIAMASDGSLSASGTFTHDANFTAGTIDAGGMAISLAAGDITLGDVTISGALDLVTDQGAINSRAVHAGTLTVDAGGALLGGDYGVDGKASLAGGSVALTSLTTGSDLTVTTRTGNLSLNTISAGGAATLQGAMAVRLDRATAAALTIKAGSDISGLSGNAAQLAATSGDLAVSAGAGVQLSGATAGGSIALDGNTVAVGGALTAGKTLAINATANMTIQDAQAGSGLALKSGGTVTTATLTAGGDASVVGGKDVSIAGLGAGGALTLTSAGNARLGAGHAGGAALIDAGGSATVGTLSAGPSLTIRASDATITGTQSAATVAFENRNADTAGMNLGDDAGSGGFSLSAAEIGLVKADTLIFRQGGGDVRIGTLAFTADAGRKAVDVLGTGLMTISGTVSGSGSGRLFQFGGSDSSDSAMANAIWVRATPTAGGRLLFGDANLDLRGDRIAAGLNEGFVDDLQDASLDTVISSFVSNANSSLYNATLGGSAYQASAPTLVSANSMTVRYGQYALFQNTGPARTNSGVVLGGTVSAPVSQALVLDTKPGSNAFALFGTVNGLGDSSTSLLGGDVISLGSADLANTRVNGCIAGSGSGCLAAVVIQPTLQVFQTRQEDVFGSANDLSVPFDPLVGGTNEELLTGLPALGPDGSDDATRREGTTE